jgi:hypothetical protein
MGKLIGVVTDYTLGLLIVTWHVLSLARLDARAQRALG